MRIVRFDGTDPKLYELVAPLVMNPVVLRQNNNYPYKTSKNHIWYLAVDDEQVAGFMPVKLGTAAALIDNYYICDDNPKVAQPMLKKIIKDFHKNTLCALVHKRHTEMFGKLGFRTTKEWTKYNKMQYDKTT